MFKFKKKDKVIVLAGKDKNKIGIISKIFKKERTAILEGVNLFYKHIKSNPNKDKSGGIKKIEVPISFSNISLINSLTNKKDKILFKKINGKKSRVFKSNGEVLI